MVKLAKKVETTRGKIATKGPLAKKIRENEIKQNKGGKMEKGRRGSWARRPRYARIG